MVGNIAALLTAGVLLGGTCNTGAAEIIRCTANDHGDVSLQLNSKRAFGRVLSCISGDFVEDMQPCAPDGGYGLSSPTGSASLVKVVNRWQDYGNHLGGVANYYTTPVKMAFSGGFMTPGSGYEELWSFEVDRVTGVAVLRTKNHDGKPLSDVPYACAITKRKF